MKKASIAGGIYFVAVSIGIGSFFIANVAVRNLSTSAWCAVLAGLLVCALPVFIINSAEKKSFSVVGLLFEKSRFKALFKLIYFLFFFILSVFLCAHFSSVINMWILPDVSKTLISSGLCFMLFLALFKNKSSVFYTVAIIAFFCIIAVLAVRSLIVFGGENIKLFPLFEKERMGENLIYPAFAAFGIFCSSALLTFVFQKRSSALSWSAGFMALGIVFILIIESCIVLIGAEQVASSFDAMVIAMKKSDLLGRGDILYFIVWMFFIACAFVSAATAPKAVLNIKIRHSHVYYFIYCLALLLLSCFVDNIKNLTEALIFILGFGGGGLIFITSAAATAISRKAKNEGRK